MKYFMHKTSKRVYQTTSNTDNFMSGMIHLTLLRGNQGTLVNKDMLTKHYIELNNQEVANILFTKED